MTKKGFLLFLLIGVAVECTVYLSAWNKGYDVGLVSKQDDDIIRGKVTCVYTKNIKKNKCVTN